MMLMISPEDFRQLSPACQQELLGLLTRDTAPLPISNPSFEESAPEWEADEYLAEEEPLSYYADISARAPETTTRPAPAETTESASKQVLDISVATARDLIANISDKSLAALTQFANGQPVSLASLIGTNAPYRDMNELKRSLVGAVNRRLRTVTDNRSAVLFASSRDRQRIHITGRSAASLRQVMQLPEPLPALGFVDTAGMALQSTDPSVQVFFQRLEKLWQNNALRPMEPRHYLLPAQMVQFLVAKGCSVRCAKPITDEDENIHYEWMSNAPATAELLTLIDPHGNVRLTTEEGLLRLRVFISQPDCANVWATWTSN